MSNLDECLECGAMVDRMAKHRRWHEALNRVAPGLQAELKRLTEEERNERPARIW